MCKLQVIRRRDSEILNDITRECPELRRISITDIPYYLTINYLDDKIEYAFKYIDHPDSKKCSFSQFEIIYGHTTGRVYSFIVNTETERIENKLWIKFMKEISESELFEKIQFEKIEIYLKILQSCDTSND